MKTYGLRCVVVGFVVAAARLAAAEPAPVAPLYFPSPEAAVGTASELLGKNDWATLARGYNLSLTPQVAPGDLASGAFFVDTAAGRSGPQAITRWRQPFAPGARFAGAEPVGDPASLPCVWTVHTVLSIDQGGGPPQRVLRDCRLLQTKDGYQFLPPAPTEGPVHPPPPAVSEVQWQARGADPVLLFRPELTERARAEVPVGRAANVGALLQAIERLRGPAAAHPGATRTRGQPWEPEKVYEPSDEELLLSLAGDRVWRTLQIAPPEVLAKLREENPSLAKGGVFYPHLEIRRVAVEGTGYRLYAESRAARRLSLGAGEK